jgi:phage terminase small subunit
VGGFKLEAINLLLYTQPMVKENKPKLNEKRKRFCEEYVVDLNGTQAAIRAEYSAKTANEQAARLLADVSVQEYIQELMNARAERVQINADYVLNTIVETIERCRQVESVRDKKGERVLVQTPDGELAAAFVFDAKNVLKGTELLGRHLKMFTDKVEHSGKDGEALPVPEFHLITPAEAARRYQELLKKKK